MRDDAGDEEVRSLTRKLDPSLLSYVVVIGVGLAAPRVAAGLYFAIALFILIRSRHRPGGSGAPGRTGCPPASSPPKG